MLAFGVMGGLANAGIGNFNLVMVDGRPARLEVGAMLGLVVGFIVGLVGWLAGWLVDVWRVPLATTLDATPHLVYQKDIRSQLVGGLVGLLTCTFGFGLTGGLLGAWFGNGFVEVLDGLGIGLIVGLLPGLVVGLLFLLNGGAAFSLLVTELTLRLGAGGCSSCRCSKPP
jgi:hypothetical protein